MKLSIKRFAELTGVSVRTLHYYDEISLLKPDCIDEQNRYRVYGEKAFERMQEILFYRELDFTLKEIKEILSSPNYVKEEALNSQKQMLILKKDRLQRIIKAIELIENGERVTDLNMFDKSEFEATRDRYKSEAKERWGATDAYKENAVKTAEYSNEKWNDIGDELNSIIAEFAKAMKSGIKENDLKALSLAARLQNFITETQYTCTKEILACVGEMYVSDVRFKRNIDRHGYGTAEFISKTIKEYCK